MKYLSHTPHASAKKVHQRREKGKKQLNDHSNRSGTSNTTGLRSHLSFDEEHFLLTSSDEDDPLEARRRRRKKRKESIDAPGFDELNKEKKNAQIKK
jgi:hypothetical protein